MSARTLLIVAGEASGDLHGAELARELRLRSPDLRLLGVGGPRMAAAGVELVADVTRFASVGVAESLSHLFEFAALYRRLISLLRRERPHAAILIDSPEFNLRFAERVKDQGIRLIYYVSPQLWAWRPGRIRDIARLVDRMVVFFPFEEELYRRHGVDARCVGHPLLDLLAPHWAHDGRAGRNAARAALGLAAPPRGDGPLIGLLPGSRRKLVARHLPILLGAAHRILGELPDARFVGGCAPGIDAGDFRRPAASRGLPLDVMSGRSYEVMRACDLLLIASGTATLEAGLLGTPMVVMYRLGFLSWLVGLALLKTRVFSLPNIVAGRTIVPERMQWDATPETLAREALAILRSDRLAAMARDLRGLRDRLGGPGAAGRAADAVLEVVGE
ncbi:MAG: lipid-A-disaccharide synthase [Planctomycetes bacterium]|nr:lipid-A-disaccharide synthase [Planctomycetota bacterium]